MSNFVNLKITKRLVAIVCLLMLLIAVAVVVALYARRRPAPPPEVLVAVSTDKVRVKAVERMGETLDLSDAETAKFSKKRPRHSSTVLGILLPETV